MISVLYPQSKDIEIAYKNIRSGYVLPEPTNKRGRFMTIPYLYHSVFLRDLQEYLDREVAGSVCYFLALIEVETGIEVLNFHVEHCIIRVASFWEHLFQLLNTYLEINLIPSKQLYKELNGDWKVSESIRLKRPTQVAKENVNIGKKVKTYLRTQGFIKILKRMFMVDKYLRPLVNLANSKETNQLNELRNLIVHQKYLSQRTYPKFVGENVQIFDVQPRSRSHAKDIGQLLNICLKNLYLGMAHARDLMDQDVPLVKKGSTMTEQSLVTVSCSCSPDQVQGIPKQFLDIPQPGRKVSLKGVFCHNCLSEDVSIIDTDFEVSKQTWDEKFVEHLNLLPNFIERKLKEIKD